MLAVSLQHEIALCISHFSLAYMLCIIGKVHEFLDAPMLRTFYVSLVCPYLDYACVVWCLFQLGDMRVS